MAQNVSLMAGKRGDGRDAAAKKWKKRDVVKKMFGRHIKWDTAALLATSTGSNYSLQEQPRTNIRTGQESAADSLT